MSWQTSPAATEVEDVVMDWLRQMLGLSEAFTGVIQDTASTATFCALLCAREKASGFSQNRGGLQAEPQPLVVYASDQGHSSIPKAALLAGFGKEHLRLTGQNNDLKQQNKELKSAADERNELLSKVRRDKKLFIAQQAELLRASQEMQAAIKKLLAEKKRLRDEANRK